MNNETEKNKHSEIIIYFRSSDKGNENCQVTLITKARLLFLENTKAQREMRWRRATSLPQESAKRFLNWGFINMMKEYWKINDFLSTMQEILTGESRRWCRVKCRKFVFPRCIATAERVPWKVLINLWVSFPEKKLTWALCYWRFINFSQRRLIYPGLLRSEPLN